MKRYLQILPIMLTTMVSNSIKAQEQDLSGFLPQGHVLFEKIEGDLNKDGEEDCVLITKGTSKDHIVKEEDQGTVDRNRRGIIILFKEENRDGWFNQIIGD